MKHAVRCALGMCLTVAAAFAANAQVFPDKPIRLIVGPGPDVLARIVGGKMTDNWGQQVVVDQRPGAGGLIAADLVSKSQPDGYTLLLADLALTSNVVYYKKQALPDPLKAFVPVAVVADTPYMLMTFPGFAPQNIKDFVAYAKANPGKINIGSSGNGGGLHLTLELFKLKAGLDLNHIPYKGGGPALSDTVAGQIQGTFIGMGNSMQYVQSGRLRPMVVAASKRHAMLPAVPTTTELGYDVVVSNWYGVVAPFGTPEPIVKRLYDEIGRGLTQPDMRERITSTGLEPIPQSPGHFYRLIEAETKRWAQTVRDAKIQTE